MKVCKGCDNVKELTEFSVNKKMKDGFLNYCKECNYLKHNDKKKEYYLKTKDNRKQYLEDNKEYIKKRCQKYHSIYYVDNREEILEYQKNYREKNIDSLLIYEKNYRSENKERRSEYHKNRKKSDNLYRFSLNIRNSIRIIFKNKNIRKNNKTQEILGCSFEELVVYLESKFDDWMTWDNKGIYNGELNYGWDIDHIIPLSSGITEDDIIKLNHYTNLQPLCSKVNRDIKKDKLDFFK